MEKVDVAIIGCGPAGLSAAVNVKARNRSVLLVGPKLCSSALHKAHRVNNYLGMPGLSGDELRKSFIRHVREMGVDITQVSVSGIFPMGDSFQLQVQDEFWEARTVILTTGVFAAKSLPGENTYVGKGISYCGTCDAMFYRDKTIAVLADDVEHEDEVRFLAEVAKKVYFLPKYEKTGELLPNVEVLRDKVKEFQGGERMETLLLAEGGELNVDGAFLLKEQMPMAQLVNGLELVEKHIKVDTNMATNIPGVFAAGDVAGKPYQVAKAVGQGQLAALSAVAYVDSKKGAPV
ncbi:NAD(P)/FAD-dependent oxidoreductase [Dethiobacter alkaliphilus]|uniref:FAD-dependent pyridine nucleotide-disulphide oxidoreductase n=1 Tax=Dethiobacter alkaliphilus AHT 1 TaxID=555088 RepID=C0GF64_DETAL|nr:NAD(P)/FAD-dependent oxidoreductase [Dethiobacter alkaliphilus]EEG77824.1 FAD-dependent pyridine nucleotide-disulphide oxidoreductase [Dethiobacter alkaliphilus AHT 1]